LGIILSFLADGDILAVTFKDIVTYLAVVAIVVALIWEDRINGYVAGRRNLKSLDKYVTVFSEEGYRSETDLGNTEWKYENINLIAETEEYFVFIFDASHAQLYEKENISGGTVEEFRKFIEKITNKRVQKI